MPPTTARSSLGSATTLATKRNFLALALTLISLFLFYIPAKAHADNTGLVGYWSFDEGTSTRATDFSGNGNTGTLTTNGSTLPTWVSGKHNKALSFDGSTNYVTVPHSASINDLGPATWALWIKRTNSAASLLYKSDGDAFAGWIVGYNSTSIGIDITRGTADMRLSVPIALVPTNEWHHLAITWTGNLADGSAGLKIYIDGAEVTTYVLQNDGIGSHTTDAAVDLRIADNTAGAGNFPGTVQGSMDDIRIYNRALSATEVANLYAAGSTLHKPPNNLGLVGYWSFDDGTGTQATDFSGSGNTGTTSATWVSGKHGKALSFNGAYVNVGSNTSLQITGAITMCSWAKSGATGVTSNFGGTRDTATNHGYQLIANSDATMTFTYFGVLDWTTGTAIFLTDNQWHHYCVANPAAGNVVFYVDGIQASSQGPLQAV